MRGQSRGQGSGVGFPVGFRRSQRRIPPTLYTSSIKWWSVRARRVHARAPAQRPGEHPDSHRRPCHRQYGLTPGRASRPGISGGGSRPRATARSHLKLGARGGSHGVSVLACSAVPDQGMCRRQPPPLPTYTNLASPTGWDRRRARSGSPGQTRAARPPPRRPLVAGRLPCGLMGWGRRQMWEESEICGPTPGPQPPRADADCTPPPPTPPTHPAPPERTKHGAQARLRARSGIVLARTAGLARLFLRPVSE